MEPKIDTGYQYTSPPSLISPSQMYAVPPTNMQPNQYNAQPQAFTGIPVTQSILIANNQMPQIIQQMGQTITPVIYLKPKKEKYKNIYYCNAVTVIVFACLNPWFGISVIQSQSRNAAIALIFLNFLITGIEIAAASMALYTDVNSGNKEVKRIVIFTFSIVGTVWCFIAMIIWLVVLIQSKNTGGNVVEQIVNSISIVALSVLFTLDIGIKIPLIVHLLLLGIRVFRVLDKKFIENRRNKINETGVYINGQYMNQVIN